MRVLLISTNQLGPLLGANWQPVMPLGLAYVAAAVREAGHEVDILDLCFVERTGEAVAQAIDGFRPEAIGISFRDIDMMAYYNQLSFLGTLQQVIDACRENSPAPVIIGGSGFSVMPEAVLKSTGLELGVVGEGEESFPLLLSRLAGGGDPSDLPGVALRQDGRVQVTHPSRGMSMLHPGDPARDLLDCDRYIRAGGSANVQTKRGCPFKCVYCTYPVIEGAAVRCRPPPEVAAEFQRIHREQGCDRFYVVDNQFNYPRDHAQAVCEELAGLRNEVDVRWSCMLNPGFVDDDLVFLLKAAGCEGVDLSAESASDRVLGSLGKNFRSREVRRAIHLLRKYRISFSTWILLGGPGETTDTIRETLDFLERQEATDVLFGVGLRVCPGTQLEKVMHAEGGMDADINLLDQVYYLAMPDREILEQVLPYCRRHANWRVAAFDEADLRQAKPCS